MIFLPEAIGLAASLTSSKKEGITQNLARMANIIKDSSCNPPEEGDHMQLVEDTDDQDRIDFEPNEMGGRKSVLLALNLVSGKDIAYSDIYKIEKTPTFKKRVKIIIKEMKKELGERPIPYFGNSEANMTVPVLQCMLETVMEKEITLERVDLELLMRIRQSSHFYIIQVVLDRVTKNIANKRKDLPLVILPNTSRCKRRGDLSSDRDHLYETTGVLYFSGYGFSVYFPHIMNPEGDTYSTYKLKYVMTLDEKGNFIQPTIIKKFCHAWRVKDVTSEMIEELGPSVNEESIADSIDVITKHLKKALKVSDPNVDAQRDALSCKELLKHPDVLEQVETLAVSENINHKKLNSPECRERSVYFGGEKFKLPVVEMNAILRVQLYLPELYLEHVDLADLLYCSKNEKELEESKERHYLLQVVLSCEDVNDQKKDFCLKMQRKYKTMK